MKNTIYVMYSSWYNIVDFAIQIQYSFFIFLWTLLKNCDMEWKISSVWAVVDMDGTYLHTHQWRQVIHKGGHIRLKILLLSNLSQQVKFTLSEGLQHVQHFEIFYQSLQRWLKKLISHSKSKLPSMNVRLLKRSAKQMLQIENAQIQARIWHLL